MPVDPIWSPTRERVEASRMHQFAERFAPGARDFASLHRTSIEDAARFWSETARFTGLKLMRPPRAIVTDFDRMPGATWFDGATLNYAANLLAGDGERVAIVFANERGERRELRLAELRRAVASIAAALGSLGIRTGDRVAGVLPNTPECVIAMLAASSIGAVWSSCSPDFGTASLLDRLGQVAPKVLFGVDGYTYAGKTIDCLPTLGEVAARLPSIETVVLTEYLGAGPPADLPAATLRFSDLLAGTAARSGDGGGGNGNSDVTFPCRELVCKRKSRRTSSSPGPCARPAPTSSWWRADR